MSNHFFDLIPRRLPNATRALIETATDNVGARIEALAASVNGPLSATADATSPATRDAERGPDDIAAILYTSGTTGW